MGLFNRKPQPSSAVQAAPTAPSGPDWSNIESIRAEWPLNSLDRAADLKKYQQALVLFERDDYSAMMQCATLFAPALAHALYSGVILQGDDLPNTLHKTLYCCLCAPPDGRTFADSAQRAARLAMTIMRENGWQPPAFGGTIQFFEPMMMDKGNYLLLSAAIAPPNEPWKGDLKAFFAVPPTPLVSSMPDPAASQGSDTINRMYETMQQAAAGDAASECIMDGMALLSSGDTEGALAKLTEAAKLGSVDAMSTAGDITGHLGRHDESRFWYESAANAGHPIAMFNVGILASERDDRSAATQWFQKAAEAGNIEGYAALTQLADEAGNGPDESHWARLGAEAGHTFCMARHGLLLARSANGDVPTRRRAREFLEQASERGHIESMVLAVSLNHQLRDPARGQRFVDMVVQSGNADAIDRLRRYGLL